MNSDPLPAELKPWAEREITRFRLGPVYDRVRRLAAPDAAAAMRERESLFDECLDRGAHFHEGNRAKIYSGDLSPGCKSCGEGTWSCLDFERRCTRRCFFCPRDPASPAIAPPRDAESGVEVDTPQAYSAYLAALGYRGASFSGGEPFLNFDRMLDYTREIRRTLGDSVVLWAYTNGDLVDEARLRALAAAGLDELRFDLGARHYDPSPLALATRWIKTVAVEVPAIPEDFDTMRVLLPRLGALGVKHLNLHQLFFTPRNAEHLAERDYTLLHSADHGYRGVVLESELTALRLLREALVMGLSLSVNYCSAVYKHRFQARGLRHRLLTAITGVGPLLADVGSTTPLGFLRRLSVPAQEARSALAAADGAGLPAGVIEREGRLFLPPSLLDSPALGQIPVRVEYLDVAVAEPQAASASMEWDIALDPSTHLHLAASSPVATVTLADEHSRSILHRLVVDQSPPASTDLTSGFYLPFMGFEFLDRRLPDYH